MISKSTNEAESVSVIAEALFATYGDDSCAYIERQMEFADTDDDRSKWLAIWEHLCAPNARRALSE